MVFSPDATGQLFARRRHRFKRRYYRLALTYFIMPTISAARLPIGNRSMQLFCRLRFFGSYVKNVGLRSRFIRISQIIQTSLLWSASGERPISQAVVRRCQIEKTVAARWSYFLKRSCSTQITSLPAYHVRASSKIERHGTHSLMKRRSLLMIFVALVALAQAVFALCRAFRWFEAGADLLGQGIILLPVVGLVAIAWGASVISIALVYVLFALGLLWHKHWARWVGFAVAAVNLLLVFSLLIQGEAVSRSMFWLIAPVTIMAYLLWPSEKAAAAADR